MNEIFQKLGFDRLFLFVTQTKFVFPTSGPGFLGQDDFSGVLEDGRHQSDLQFCSRTNPGRLLDGEGLRGDAGSQSAEVAAKIKKMRK